MIERLKRIWRELLSPERQHGYGTTLLPAAVALSILILLSGGIATMGAIDSEREAREASQYTTGVIARLEKVRALAVDAETGQRGYLLTGQRRYLKPLKEAMEREALLLDELKTYAYGNMEGPQENWLMQIDRLTNEHLAETQASVRMARRGNRNEAIETLKMGGDMRRMDRLRVLIDQYENYEYQRQAAGLAEARQYAQIGGRQVLVVVTVLILLLLLIAYLLWRNSRLLQTETELSEITEAKEQVELISRELNHRVKNLFAVVMAIISMTARRESDAKVAGEKMRERVNALARAHQLTLDQDGGRAVSLGSLVDNVLAPYLSDRLRYETDGPEVQLIPRYATPIGLALHEMATNAVKYGAWCQESGGVISVRWTVEEDENLQKVALVWQESGGPPVTAPSEDGKGFGSQLVLSSLRQIGGRFESIWPEKGFEARLFFAVQREPDKD
ncbi:sensor histidine kinase [Novosphingopyxis sp. YJ-S2-01]|uniref:sensor histidine kinase n=1 Tax=Novosphingopyxis sp. YJ-S2-01 TaxID=2794021 RepID=UPI0018DBE8B9|nr:CHASE3 domain-containing protein [Novosphingopyxis sp. YJ-S2-01]MBH9536465.1 CHASE3 domain-containing protein [Novosphingopyxis sp. YJ-S2-01]